jgi:transcriptional regulator with XRE-family HTH domain
MLENVMLNIKAIASMMNMSIKDLAEKTDIDYGHLKQVSSGRVKMTAYDLKKLSEVSGVPTDNIRID